jgi:DNA-binding response OmpR family regulator
MDTDNASVNKKKVLIADTDRLSAAVYQDGLVEAGYGVAISYDGQDVLDMLKSETPDILIIELMLPKVNGFEILQYAQKQKKLHKIPIIILTNLSQSSDENEARELGAADFLVKSDTSVPIILDRLNKLL